MTGKEEKKYTQNDLEIALLQKEMSGLREQQKAHATEMRASMGDVQEDLKELTAALNRGKGMFAGAMLAAGAVGGVVTKLLGVLVR